MELGSICMTTSKQGHIPRLLGQGFSLSFRDTAQRLRHGLPHIIYEAGLLSVYARSAEMLQIQLYCLCICPLAGWLRGQTLLAMVWNVAGGLWISFNPHSS